MVKDSGSQPGTLPTGGTWPTHRGYLKIHENIGFLVKYTWGTSGVLWAEKNSADGTLTEKGWEPLV